MQDGALQEDPYWQAGVDENVVPRLYVDLRFGIRLRIRSTWLKRASQRDIDLHLQHIELDGVQVPTFVDCMKFQHLSENYLQQMHLTRSHGQLVLSYFASNRRLHQLWLVPHGQQSMTVWNGLV